MFQNDLSRAFSGKLLHYHHDHLTHNNATDDSHGAEVLICNFWRKFHLTHHPGGHVCSNCPHSHRGGHFAPLAAWHESEGMVLVLEPNQKYFLPHWVSVDYIVWSMTRPDRTNHKQPRGYFIISSP
eukprot:TRINITY_DN6295_c0_g1_i1.p1 TRINITY_DN6295_c0_g1~~TRINITY_DN6295_c0_g1_i1.p1  ORF type:complete len:126 (-),score=10.17 TRINITY_DN6295_c0_g1_i1:81-458(-)